MPEMRNKLDLWMNARIIPDVPAGLTGPIHPRSSGLCPSSSRTTTILSFQGPAWAFLSSGVAQVTAFNSGLYPRPGLPPRECCQGATTARHQERVAAPRTTCETRDHNRVDTRHREAASQVIKNPPARTDGGRCYSETAGAILA